MNVQTRLDLQVILDCMSGADGGMSYLRLRALLDDIEHDESDEANKLKHAIQTVANVIKVISR